MSDHYPGFRYVINACLFLVLFMCCGGGGESMAMPQTGVMNAFYLQKVPSSYADQERLFTALYDTGANAAIVELPLTAEGLPDLVKIPDIVYLVHKAGLKVMIVMPTRRLPGVLLLHRDWEDERYDLEEGSTGHSGKLDLFRTEVVLYLADLAKRLASYSVDGIFLGEDFAYGPGDGMSDAALKMARERLGASVRPKKMFLKVSRGRDGVHVDEYGELFWNWAELKRDHLLQVYDAMMSASRSVKSGLQLGIPAPVVLPVPVAREVLAQYSYDMGAFRERNVDYYWTRIASHDGRDRQKQTFWQAKEVISRIAQSTATTVRNVEKRVIVLDATSADGRLLPFSVIEETSGLVKNSGNTGIAYAVTSGTVLSKSFMQKMFGRRD